MFALRNSDRNGRDGQAKPRVRRWRAVQSGQGIPPGGAVHGSAYGISEEAFRATGPGGLIVGDGIADGAELIDEALNERCY